MGKKIKTTQGLYPTDITATGATKLREYEALKTCKHCGHKFVIHQLKTGRELIYCRDSCRYNYLYGLPYCKAFRSSFSRII